MKARIEPLKGKYYGSHVAILDGPLAGHRIELWFAMGAPSTRQLEDWGFTQAQWDDDVEVDDGWGGKTHLRTGGECLCDSHYECAETYRVAQAIVDALASLPPGKP